MRKGIFSTWTTRIGPAGEADAPRRALGAIPRSLPGSARQPSSLPRCADRIAAPGRTATVVRLAAPRTLAAVCAMALLASCGLQGESATPTPVEGDARFFKLTAGLPCEAATDILDCVRRNESSAVRKHAVAISRSDGALCLAGPETDEVCLPQARQIEHRFLERTHGYFVVVEIEHSEGYTVLLIDEKTGSRSRIDNPPLFASSKDYFATVSYDTDAGYLPNRVAIWNSKGSELLYKVDRFAPGTGPTRIQWESPTRVQVRYSQTPYSAEPDENTKSFSVWKDATGSWHEDYTR